MDPDQGPRGVTIYIFDEFEGLVSENWLRSVAEFTLALDSEGSNKRNGLGVVLADDGTVRDLNRRHRGLDETTDVLAFSFHHQGEYHGDEEAPSQWSQGVDFVTPPGEGAGLGEVVISYPRAARQAEASGYTVRQEVAHLLAHGVLHLLGYDHVERGEEAAMKAKEARVLAQVLADE